MSIDIRIRCFYPKLHRVLLDGIADNTSDCIVREVKHFYFEAVQKLYVNSRVSPSLTTKFQVLLPSLTNLRL